MIGSSRATSARVLDAYFDGQFELIYSADSLDELLNVLLIPKIRRRHGLLDDEVLDFIAALIPFGRECTGTSPVSHSLAHDVTDTKFLALADESAADYLVTNDHRQLLVLGKYHQTRIVTPTEFLQELH